VEGLNTLYVFGWIEADLGPFRDPVDKRSMTPKVDFCYPLISSAVDKLLISYR